MTDDHDTPDETDPEAPTEALDPAVVRMAEALLFAAAEPLTERVLANRLPDGTPIKAVLKELQGQYADRGVHLVRAGNSWAFRTAPDLSDLFNRETEVTRKLSRAALETLAIIAYHQPVTRAEIEEIRGVGLSKGTLDVLFEEGWVKPRGRKQTPGRPTLWGTTDGFLDHFGLERINDLPGIGELKAAGLLDTRPAIEAYAVRATEGDSAPRADGDDALAGEEAPVTNRPADEEVLVDDPLDPDDGSDEPAETLGRG